jgi:signal transduction histidine kinase
MVELATKTLRDQKGVTSYFTQQMFILDEIVIMTVTLIVLCYTLLGLHLYAKVSGAAFGIFSTMRAFMKGNYSSRVHLVGFSYVREYTRKLNKYLDYIQNNFTKEQPKK